MDNPIILFGILIFVTLLIGATFLMIAKDIIRKRKTASLNPAKNQSFVVSNLPDKGIEQLIEEGRIDEAVEVYRTVTGIDEYSARDAISHLLKQNKR